MPRDSTVCLTLAGAVLLAYGNAFWGAFQFDDYKVIVNATETQAWDAWLGSLANGYRPLLKLSYLLNHALGVGTFGTFGFHLFNLLVHGGNTMLVYLLALQFGRRCDAERDWCGPALCAALLFAVHPLHSEAVTYLSGRSASLMTLFYFAALWTYERSLAPGQYKLRLLSLGLSMLALLTKESAMLFPLALLAWEWACRTPWRVVVQRQWPYWLLFAMAVLVLLVHPKYWTLMWESVQLRSLHDSFLTQAYVSVVQAGKLFWPFALNIDPDWAVIKNADTVWPQLLLILAAGAAAVYCRAARPWLSLGLVWLLLHLLPLNTFFPRADIANERQLYWADWPMLFALAVEAGQRLPRRVAVLTLVLLCGVLTATTLARNTIYHSEVALWEDTVAKSPNKARVWNNLGYAYQLEGRKADAVRAYCVAIRLNPGHVKAHNNLARLNGACAPVAGETMY
ncbi:MAG: hypothetical protein ACOY4U_07640 [Pseudomonadota bacterium]